MREYQRGFLRWLPGGSGVALLIVTRFAQFKGWLPALLGMGLIVLAYGLVLLAVSLESWRAIPKPLTAQWVLRWLTLPLAVFGVLTLIGSHIAQYEGWLSQSLGQMLAAIAYGLLVSIVLVEGWRAIRSAQRTQRRADLPTLSIPMLGLLLVGAALRLHDLNKAPLWFDELWSVYVSRAPTLLDVPSRLPMNWTPAYPTAILLLRPLFGETEFAVRWPSAAAGVITIAALYALGKRLFNPRVSLLAAALLTVSLPFISYSQEARAYMFVVLAAILCSTIWLDLLHRLEAEHRPILPLALLYIGSALFMTTSHFVGLVILAIQALMLILRFVRMPHRLYEISMIYTAIGFGCAVMILPSFLNSFVNGFQWLDWYPVPDPFSIVLAEYLGMPFANYVPLTVVVYALVGLSLVVLLWRRQLQWYSRGAFTTAFLLTWWIAPFIAVLVVSWLVQPVYHPRYVLAMLPPALLLISAAISKLPLRPNLSGALAICVVAALAIALWIGSPYYATKDETLGYRTGVWALDDVLKNDPDAVWGWLAYYSPQIYEYDLDRASLAEPPLGGLGIYQPEKVIPQFDAALEQTRPASIWLLFFDTSPATPNEIAVLIEQSRWKLTLIEKRSYDMTTLWHLRVEPRSNSVATVE